MMRTVAFPNARRYSGVGARVAGRALGWAVRSSSRRSSHHLGGHLRRGGGTRRGGTRWEFLKSNPTPRASFLHHAGWRHTGFRCASTPTSPGARPVCEDPDRVRVTLAADMSRGVEEVETPWGMDEPRSDCGTDLSNSQFDMLQQLAGVCSVCKHLRRPELEAALASGTRCETPPGRFGASRSALGRHAAETPEPRPRLALDRLGDHGTQGEGT